MLKSFEVTKYCHFNVDLVQINSATVAIMVPVTSPDEGRVRLNVFYLFLTYIRILCIAFLSFKFCYFI